MKIMNENPIYKWMIFSFNLTEKFAKKQKYKIFSCKQR